MVKAKLGRTQSHYFLASGMKKDAQLGQGKRASPPIDVVLQRGAAKLERDVSELPVLLHAEVPDDVGMFVGLSEEIDFAVGDAEAGSEDALHGHVAVVETAPGKKR